MKFCWDGKDADGKIIPAGIYLVGCKTERKTCLKKVSGLFG